MLDALRRGHTYASNGPHDPRRRSRRRQRSRCSCITGPPVINLMSHCETRLVACAADDRNRMEDARILERNDRGLIVRARFTPPTELPYRRLVVEDETGRKAWSNAI